MGKALFTQGVRVCALILILAWYALGAAQTTPVISPDKPVPTKGTWALQGELGTALSASRYSYSISAQHYSSKTKAIRYGLSFSGNMNWNDYKINSRDSSNNSIGISSHESDSDQHSGAITFSTACVKLVPAGDKTTFYWGVGPLLSLSMSRRTTTTDNYSYTQKTIIKNHGARIGIGGKLILGTEYAITNRIRLSGDYAFSLEYGYYKSSETQTAITPTTKTITTAKNNNHSIGISVIGLKIGMSVLI